VTPRRGAWLTLAGSAAAFVATFFLRMNAAYGPFNLAFGTGDWTVLWELWRHGQIASRVVAESVAAGAAAATVPWLILGLLIRCRGTR
jgi:hypothetical protein